MKTSPFLLCVLLFVSACIPYPPKPEPGPDKQFLGTVWGAAVGAGAGAVTGAQVTSVTGPGAVVGAGFGAVYGMFSGIGQDLLEESQLSRQEQERWARKQAWAQEVLTEHYARRMELHPNRDIFPADLFFEGDGVELKDSSHLLVGHIAEMTKRRMPWSRIVVAAYATSKDKQSDYASYLTRRRAENIALAFIRHGVEPRRLKTRGLALADPVVFDPDDSFNRYRQAIEIIPLDY